jgi:hypothetical protein
MSVFDKYAKMRRRGADDNAPKILSIVTAVSLQIAAGVYARF